MSYKENSCDCERCQLMCEVSPCIPTPEQIADLEKAGLKQFFKPTVWVDVEGDFAMHEIIAPIGVPQEIQGHPVHRCIFLNGGKCMLHARGLKPTEGKLANHDLPPGTDLRRFVCGKWKTDEAKIILKEYS